LNDLIMSIDGIIESFLRKGESGRIRAN
jgi:hypothetical protein